MSLDVDQFVKSLPPDTTRVRVITANGLLSYRKVEELLPTDEPVMGPTGFPVVMKGRVGALPKFLRNQPNPVPMALAELTSVAVVTPTPIQSLGSAAILDEPNSIIPEDPEVEKVEQVRQTRRKRHGRNAVLREVKRNPSADSVFDVLMHSLAEEAEMLEFERDKVLQLGQPSGHLTEQRLRVMKMMTDAWLKRRSKSNGSGVDLDSPAFAAVFAFLLETLRASMEDAGMRQEFIETVFAKVSKRLNDDWKNEAMIRIREKATA